MSLFSCPNASRSLLRVAVRGLARTSPKPFCPPRWISTSKPQIASRSRFTSEYPHQCRRTFFSDKTIKKYEDLPKDYRDQLGLPFRSLDLKDSEVASIFGDGIDPVRANILLRILHGRRVAGTLDDPAFAIHTAQFTTEQKARALEYLRKSVPVNEIFNAGLRAEDELAQMEAEMAAKSAKEPEAKKVYTADAVYGHSRIDEIRAQNVAKRKAQEAIEEEERKQAVARGEVNSGTLAEVRNKPREIQNPKIAQYYKEAESPMVEAPEMKAWERILPSATVVALFLGFMVAVSSVYEEPEARFRLFPEISTAQATMATIVGINLLVFAAWRAPPLWKFLNKYMILVVGLPKPITMLTAPFSHQKFGHMVVNLIPLFFIGGLVHQEIGRANFLTLYLGCGALGFLGTLASYTFRGALGVTSLGASGATWGLIAAYFWGHATDRFRFFGLPDEGVHGVIFLAICVALNLATIGYAFKFKMDVVSHITGLVVGMLGIEYFQREQERKEFVITFPDNKWYPRIQVSEPEPEHVMKAQEGRK